MGRATRAARHYRLVGARQAGDAVEVCGRKRFWRTFGRQHGRSCHASHMVKIQVYRDRHNFTLYLFV